MPPKRLHSFISPNDSGISSDDNPSKRAHASSASPIIMDTQESSLGQYPLRVYIISAKFSPSVLENLVTLVESNAMQRSDMVGSQRLELAVDLEHADIVVTAIHTRTRLERHLRWEVARTKAIVTPEWLRDSANSGTIQPCGKYAALAGLYDDIEHQCPKLRADTPETPPNYCGPPRSSADQDVDVNDTDSATLNYMSHFCCQRASPLTCPNQALVEELDIIRRARLYEGEERSMLSYARAIASIKGRLMSQLSLVENSQDALAYPHSLDGQNLLDDIARLPYLGMKLASMVEEFIKTGKVQDAQTISSSTRFLSLSTFNSVHGIGSQTARHLYSLGLRSIEDLEKYYEVTPEIAYEGTPFNLEASSGKELGVENSIRIALALRHDLSQTIPRREVEEINQVIVQELELVEAGYKTIIAGGYRRGKLSSNDVDIIISHTDWDHGADKVRGLCKKLLQRLHKRGLITHVLHMGGYHPHSVFRTHHWDSLEKALTVFVLPWDPARKQTHRRVDLIFATPGVFWTAVVGWTGSTMFQRDLRLWAKKAKRVLSLIGHEIPADTLCFRGFKFDSSGITRRHDSKVFHPKSEKEVFELLGLVYVHPTLRNADA